MVVNEVKKAPFQPTEKSLKELKDLHLASILKTHLMRSPKTKTLTLEVKADSSTGKVTVSGTLPADAEKVAADDIRSVLSSVESVKDVEVKVAFG